MFNRYMVGPPDPPLHRGYFFLAQEITTTDPRSAVGRRLLLPIFSLIDNDADPDKKLTTLQIKLADLRDHGLEPTLATPSYRRTNQRRSSYDFRGLPENQLWQRSFASGSC